MLTGKLGKWHHTSWNVISPTKNGSRMDPSQNLLFLTLTPTLSLIRNYTLIRRGVCRLLGWATNAVRFERSKQMAGMESNRDVPSLPQMQFEASSKWWKAIRGSWQICSGSSRRWCFPPAARWRAHPPAGTESVGQWHTRPWSPSPIPATGSPGARWTLQQKPDPTARKLVALANQGTV